MNRLHLAVVVLIAAASATAVHAEGNKAAGRTLVYTCAGCHGVPGYNNAAPQYPVPKIVGQNAQYLVNALHGYQNGDRSYPTMVAQAQGLSNQDIEDIAAYLSSLAPALPPLSAAQKQTLAELEKTEAGQKARVCTSCHGEDGNSIDPQYPRLAGQYSGYIAQILHEYKDGRRNNPIMKGMVTTLSDQDIEQISSYFANLPQALGRRDELDTLKGHIQGD